MSGLLINVPMNTTRVLDTSFIPFYDKENILGYFIGGGDLDRTLKNRARSSVPFTRRGAGDSMEFYPAYVKVVGNRGPAEAIRLPISDAAGKVNPQCTIFMRLLGMPKVISSNLQNFIFNLWGESPTIGNHQNNKLMFSVRPSLDGKSFNFFSGAPSGAPQAENNVLVGDVRDDEVIYLAASRGSAGLITVELRVSGRIIKASIPPVTEMPAVPDDLKNWHAWFGVMAGTNVVSVSYQRGAIYNYAMSAPQISELLDRESVV